MLDSGLNVLANLLKCLGILKMRYLPLTNVCLEHMLAAQPVRPPEETNSTGQALVHLQSQTSNCKQVLVRGTVGQGSIQPLLNWLCLALLAPVTK